MKIRNCFRQLSRVRAYITEERIIVRLWKNFQAPGTWEIGNVPSLGIFKHREDDYLEMILAQPS
jgi:hypothetical protein